MGKLGFSLLFLSFFIVGICGTPLKPTKEKPISVIDIPADDFEVSAKEHPIPVVTEEKIDPINVESGETEIISPDEKQPGKFRPTVIIIQRQPLFPFSFSNPFNTRIRPIFSQSSEESGEDGLIPPNRGNDPIDSMMTRLHSQMSSLWDALLPPLRRRPVVTTKDQVGSSSDDEAERVPSFARPTFFQPIFPSFNFPKFPAFPPGIFNQRENETDTGFDSFLPKNLTNSTTSETKVVDGHVVTVNKTTHTFGDKDKNGSGFFSFQVINVRPTPGAPETVTPTEKPAIIPTESKDYDTSIDNNKKVEVEIQPDPSSNEVDDPKDKPKVSGIDDGLLE